MRPADQNGPTKRSVPTPAEIDQIVALFNAGNPVELENRTLLLIEQYPASGFAWMALGTALQAQGKNGLPALQKATELMPNNAEAHMNLGNTLKELGRLDDAVASYRLALGIKPDFVMAHYNLGNALKGLGQLDDAVASYQRALKIKPHYAEAHNNLGNALKDLGRLDEALASYRQALEIRPDFSDAHNNLLFVHNYLSDQPATILLAEARRFGDLVARKIHPHTSWHNVPESGKCLRVGLVSGDLRSHSVGHFIGSMLAALVSQFPGRLEIIAYSNCFESDALTERIRACCHGWHSVVRLSDEQLAKQVRDEGIDILIDLSGHTAYNRLPMFAWKPAPVQVSWLGYFATTGVAAIDYLIADPWTLPESEETYFTEKIWRLPETRLCFTPPDVDVQVGPLPALSSGQVTFGSFNNLPKMNDDVVALWARVLAAVPDSRLFLMAGQFKEASVRQNTIGRFATHGIAAHRITMEGFKPRKEYLSAYHRVDIALDPFPFPGGTTSVEGLWMGVPVLTLAGERFLSRQGVGILTNVGLSEWIATDTDNYVARAVTHAGDLQCLAALRSRLRQQVVASPLLDAPRFAKHFEAALRGMWEVWCDQRTKTQNEKIHDAGASASLRKSCSSGAFGMVDAKSASKIANSAVQEKFQKALALHQQGQLDQAQTLYEEVLETQPEHFNALHLSGVIASQSGNQQKAIALIDKAIAFKPNFADAYSNRGIALHKLKQFDAALASFDKAIAFRPDYVEAYYNRGLTLHELEQFDAALASFDKTIALQPSHVEAYYNRGFTLSKLKQFDTALASYDEAITLRPDYAEAHNNRGFMLYKLKRFDAALAS